MTTLHVEPRDARWIVRRDDKRVPMSSHPEASAASRAAREQAGRDRETSVLLHDRYNRIHHLK